jgi:YjbE family integral membrane protein
MLAELSTPFFWTALLQIIGINILLSGDNAVVIALASRSLPPEQRKWAILGGSGAAILLRIIFSVLIVWLLAIPLLKLIGGLLLLYIGIKLIIPEAEHGEGSVAAKSNLWGAVVTITIADAVMSLDNVVAIAAAAQGSILLISVGLVISVPLIVFGSQLVLGILTRFPVLIVAGGGLLGWIAGEIIVSDKVVHDLLPYDIHMQELVARPLLAAAVVIVGLLLARRKKVDHHAPVDLAPEDKK